MQVSPDSISLRTNCPQRRALCGCPLSLAAMRRSGVVVLFFAASLAASTLSASTIVISGSGEFNNTTGVSAFTAPNGTWAFSFDVNTYPSVSNVSPDNYFDAAFSDFTYDLNGSPVAITPVDIRFFSTPQDGGFNICFTVACSDFNSPTDGLEFLGSQLYQGSTSAPQMITGNFTSSYFDAFANGMEYNQSNHQSIVATAATVATPEPSQVLPMAAGLAILALARKLRCSRT
jgi:hypothetical protein